MDLHKRIETYLRRESMAPARFGRAVLNDPCFVFDLRLGRELRPATRKRVLAWLEARESNQV